jgi:hypothetical protein
MWEIMSRIMNLKSGTPLQAPEMTTAEIHALTGVEDGMIVYNTDTRQLLSHVGGSWLAISNASSAGTVTSVDTDIDLTGGPITGAGTIGLADTDVTEGSYTYASITVSKKGRITAASSGANPVLSVTNSDGTITVDSTDPANPVVSLADTAVTAGEYTAANITVDAQGRIVSASNGDIGTVDSVVGTDGQIVVNSDDPANPVVSLADTAVTAGEYIAANITVDAQGRIVSASNGYIGTVDSVVGTDGQIVVNSDDPANPVVSLADTAVNPNSYFAAAITVDKKGRITGASNSVVVNNIVGVSGRINVTSTTSAAKTCTIDLVNTSVVPGEYTAANITVDSTGRITAASNGSSASGVESVVGTGGQINVDATDPANPVVSLADTAVTAGEYIAANITVDSTGRITAASSNLIPETTTPTSIVTWGANGRLVDNPNTQIDNAGNMTLSGTVTASSFNSVGNLNIEESGKLRITSANQGVVQLNANPDLTDQINVIFSDNLTFPSHSGNSGQILTTDGLGNLSWQSNLSSITSRDGTIMIDTSDPIDVDIELAETGIAANTYTNPSSITFDKYGRATAATNGVSIPHGMLVLTSGSGTLASLLPAGVTSGKVTVIGGGGNGGNVSSTTSVGTGGGAGGTAIKYVTDLSTSSTYSVGAAGVMSTFSTNTVSMNANPGSNGVAANSTSVQLGGAGGVATGGDINISGERGDNCSSASTVGSGKGGNSSLANGGSGVVTSGNGTVGFYGSGGSGAFKNAAGIGGVGGSGVIIIEY